MRLLLGWRTWCASRRQSPPVRTPSSWQQILLRSNRSWRSMAGEYCQHRSPSPRRRRRRRRTPLLSHRRTMPVKPKWRWTSRLLRRLQRTTWKTLNCVFYAAVGLVGKSSDVGGRERLLICVSI
eukprot:Rmarinus@m.15806